MLAASACGRIGFDSGVPGDGGEDDAGDVRSRCPAAPLPDLSNPDRVVGDGTPASCTQAVLQAALDAGGTIALRCGPAPSTIALAGELAITRATVLDGGGLVTLDAAASAGRHLRVAALGAKVVLLGLTFEAGAVAEYGGAVYVQGGDLVVIGSTFRSNAAVTGGAIGVQPTAGTLAIYDSVIEGNTAKDGGGIYAFDDLTVVETAIRGNRADGPPDGTAGGLGGGITHAGPGSLEMCGVTLADNFAGYLGGGMHRVCTMGQCPDTIERSSVVSNTSANAGGAYVQNTATLVRQSTIAGNTATGSGVGGLWYIGAAGLTAEQITVAGNTMTSGLGAGLRIEGPGSIAFSTFASNACTSVSCDSGGLEVSAEVTLRASVIANNSTVAGSTCRTAMNDGAGSFQWPTEASPCAPSVQFVDPQLGDAAERSGAGGTFVVASPEPTSPVRGAVATGCPAEDQLGRPRPSPCSAGAIEP